MTQPGCENALILLVSRIKQSANAAGVCSVRDMALASGVSKSGVHKIYNLLSYPTFDTLLAMANAVGATVHEWTENLEQEASQRGKRPEPNSKPPKAPEPASEPSEPKEPAKTKPEPAKQPEPASEPSGASGEPLDLMAMLSGMNPNLNS